MRVAHCNTEAQAQCYFSHSAKPTIHALNNFIVLLNAQILINQHQIASIARTIEPFSGTPFFFIRISKFCPSLVVLKFVHNFGAQLPA